MRERKKKERKGGSVIKTRYEPKYIFEYQCIEKFLNCYMLLILEENLDSSTTLNMPKPKVSLTKSCIFLLV